MQEHAPHNITATRRKYPQLLSRHLLQEFMLPLCGTIAAFLMVTLLLAVFDDLPDFSGTGLPLGTIVIYFLARIPENLMMVFPISALLAVSFMNAVLGKNSELTAIRSAGLSLPRVATRIWFVILFLCFISFCLNELVTPACKQFVETMQIDYLNRNARKLSKQHSVTDDFNLTAFYNPQNGQDWFFADFKPEGSSIGISVCLHDKEGRITSVVTAAEGAYNRQNGAWNFHGVSITDYEYPDGEAYPIEKPTRFQDALPAPDEPPNKTFNANPRDIAIQSRALDQMPMKDLLRMRRRNIMLNSSYRGLVRTMIAYRAVSPLATLIAGLLGFALTLIRGRTTVLKGFVIAVGLFVGYYLLSQFFLILGKNGHLNWIIAGAAPTIAALAAALWITYKRQ